MNRYIFLFLIAAFSLLLHAKCVGQNNIVYGAGISYTNGVPTFVPPSKSARVAIDTVTSKWYEYATPGGWRWSGDRVQDISGCAAPAYTPGKAQSRLVLNSCTEAQNGHGPELYKYTGSAWLCLNCGGNYTAGDGIDITGTEITNTAPDQVVSITGAGINAITGTYPNFTVTGTEVDGSVTNELQTLSVVGNNLTISDGNTVTLPTPSSTLDALTDVTITAPTNAQILQYNTATTQWVNATLAAITGSGAANRLAYWDDATNITSSSSLLTNGTVVSVGGGSLATDHAMKLRAPANGWALTMYTSSNSFIGGFDYLGRFTFSNAYHNISSTNAGTVTLGGRELYFLNDQALNSGDAMFRFGGLGNKNITTGNIIGYLFTGKLANTTSGSASFTGVEVRQTINSLSSGAVRGIYYNPTITNINGAHYGLVVASGQVGIGTSTPISGAAMEVKSTTAVMVPPNMTSTQRDAIASPPNGIIYNTTTGKYQGYAAGAWVDLH